MTVIPFPLSLLKEDNLNLAMLSKKLILKPSSTLCLLLVYQAAVTQGIEILHQLRLLSNQIIYSCLRRPTCTFAKVD